MANKQQTQAMLDKIGDDEELFLLRAQDKFFGKVIRMWCTLVAMESGPMEKVKEAMACAERGEKWPVQKVPD